MPQQPMSPHDAADMPPPFRITEMMLSVWVPQAIYAAAALGIPDELAGAQA